MRTPGWLRRAVLPAMMLAALAFGISLPLAAVHASAVAAVITEDPSTPVVDEPVTEPPAEDPAAVDGGGSTNDQSSDPAGVEPSGGASQDATGADSTDENADPAAEGEATDAEPSDGASDGAADGEVIDEEAVDGEVIDETSDEEAVVDEASDADVTDETGQLAGSALISVDFGEALGESAAGLPISVSGSGLSPLSQVELWVFSTPRLLATSTTSDAGEFEMSAALPSDLDPGDHTVLVRGADSDGSVVEQGSTFTIDADGLITGITADADVSALEVPALPDSAMAPQYPVVNALDTPAAVVATAVAGLAIIAIVGVGASGAASGLGARAAGDSVAGGGIKESTGSRADEAGHHDVSHNRGWRRKFSPKGTAAGDNSPVHRFPGTSVVDEASFMLTAAVATKSPLLSRTIADAAPLRAILGSLSLLLPVAAGVLGVIGALQGNGIAEPPTVGILAVLIVIGVLDALAGLVGALAFSLVVAFSGGIIDVSSVRTLLGIALLLVGPGMIAGTFRDIRRLPQSGGAYVWERLADFVIVPLLGGYTTYNIVSALPPLGGSQFPIAESALFLGGLVAVALVAKVALEEIGARWFPERMATVQPAEVDDAGIVQQTISGLLRVSVFVFVSAAFIGNVWQLWVAGIIFVIPLLVSPLSARFPNSARLWRVLPEGLPYLGITLLLYSIVTAVLLAKYGETSDYARVSFLVLLIPDFLVAILWWFGRHGSSDDEVRWFLRPSMVTVYRVGGVVVLALTIWLAYRASS